MNERKKKRKINVSSERRTVQLTSRAGHEGSMADHVALTLILTLVLRLSCASSDVEDCNHEYNSTECSLWRRFYNATAVPIGETVNVLDSYGFLASNIKVASNFQRNDAQVPLFQLVTHSVLDQQQFNININMINRSFTSFFY